MSIIDMQGLQKKREQWPLKLIISKRGGGKTSRQKNYLRDQYLKTGEKAIWLMNTDIQIKSEVKNFVESNKQVWPELWEGVEMQGNYAVDTNTGEWFIQLIDLKGQHKQKGSRDPRVKHITYEEFNEGLTHIGSSQTYLFENSIATYTDVASVSDGNDLRVTIFGNMRTLSTDLLVKLGVKVVTDEETFYYDPIYNQPLLYIYAPTIPKNQLEDEHKNDWAFRLGRLTGNGDHIHGNTSVLDDVNGIREIDTESIGATPISQYKINGSYFLLYRFSHPEIDKGKKRFYLKYIKQPLPHLDIVAGNKKDMEQGLKYTPELKHVFLDWISKERLYFDTMNTKLRALEII